MASVIKKFMKINERGSVWPTLSPFLFCVYHNDNFPAGDPKTLGPQGRIPSETRQFSNPNVPWKMYHGDTVPGFPGHPHRGFETLTIVTKGFVDHADSLGTSGRYGGDHGGAPDVQWMTAGRGVQHSEMFPLLNPDKPNPLCLFQVWLNLPSASRLVSPDYKMLWAEDVPVFETPDAEGPKTKIHIISGTLNGTKALAPPKSSWAATSEAHVRLLLIKMDAGASWRLPAGDPKEQTTLWHYGGDSDGVQFGGEGGGVLGKYTGVYLDLIPTDGADLVNLGPGEAHLMLLAGIPIDEPVVQHGPFVVDSQEQLQQTFKEYSRTQFGGWPWGEPGPVFARDSPRFAKYADGSEEKRP